MLRNRKVLIIVVPLFLRGGAALALLTTGLVKKRHTRITLNYTCPYSHNSPTGSCTLHL